MEKYELFYSTGGHGGPYIGLRNARAAAKRLLVGSNSLHRIDIRPYEKGAVGGYGRPVESVYKSGDGEIICQRG